MVRITFENGWALVRASNTGPNLILRFEAKDSSTLSKIQKEFSELVEEYNV